MTKKPQLLFWISTMALRTGKPDHRCVSWKPGTRSTRWHKMDAKMRASLQRAIDRLRTGTATVYATYSMQDRPRDFLVA